MRYRINNCFTKEYTTKKIVTSAMFIAANIILTHILAIQTPFIRIDLGFLPIAIFSMLFGPFRGAIVAGIADILGCLIFSPGMFFPGFTLSAVTAGFIYGFYFFNKTLSLQRVVLASLTIFLLVDMCMNTLWLAILYHKSVETFIIIRALKSSIMLPVQVLLIYNIHKRLRTRNIPSM